MAQGWVRGSVRKCMQNVTSEDGCVRKHDMNMKVCEQMGGREVRERQLVQKCVNRWIKRVCSCGALLYGSAGPCSRRALFGQVAQAFLKAILTLYIYVNNIHRARVNIGWYLATAIWPEVSYAMTFATDEQKRMFILAAHCVGVCACLGE